MKYNHASFKQSHNSYDRNESIATSLEFNAEDPGDAGCCGLEYDIHRHSDDSGGASRGYFTVNHATSGGPPLANYLDELMAWHKTNPTHDVIFITLDIKSEQGSMATFPDEIDTYLKTWFKASLCYSPGELSPDSDDFVGHVRQHGWPDMSVMKGKFIFCLSGNTDWKSNYASTKPRERLCFSDIDCSDSEPVNLPQSGQQIIYSAHLYSSEASQWQENIGRLRSANLLSRGYVLNNENIWGKAKTGKLNLFATDEITGHAWAHVGDTAYVIL